MGPQIFYQKKCFQLHVLSLLREIIANTTLLATVLWHFTNIPIIPELCIMYEALSVIQYTSDTMKSWHCVMPLFTRPVLIRSPSYITVMLHEMQITGNSYVCSTACSAKQQRKHKNYAYCPSMMKSTCHQWGGFHTQKSLMWEVFLCPQILKISEPYIINWTSP